ncbi:MAG: glycosyltransferase family A protein [Pseudomonadota bacterium]
MTASVSVVVPTYGRPHHLAAAVESALSQTYPLTEIIVVDDASPDDVRASLSRFDEAVTYIRQPRNMGANAARNRGVSIANGEFIAFLDDDDLWLPTKTELQLEAMRRQGAEACLCGYQVMGSARRQVRGFNSLHAKDIRPMKRVAGFSSLVVRRSVIVELGLDESLHNTQDWDIYARLVQRNPIAYVPRALYHYRTGMHDGISSRARNASLDEIEARTATIRKHRSWMGEWRFRARLADIYLSYIRHRRNPWKFLHRSFANAGIPATLMSLGRGVYSKMGRMSSD